jgi:endo-1,3(4)-beta-glucanase
MNVDFSTGPLGPSDSFSNPFGLGELVAQFTQAPIIPAPIPHQNTTLDDSSRSSDSSTGETTAAVEADWDLQPSIMGPISTNPPLSIFEERMHPVEPMRVRTEDRSKPLPTNKFYGNLMLGDSHAPIWTHPYGLRWDSIGQAQQGIGISQIDDSSKVLGPPEEVDASDPQASSARFYLNPFLVSMGISATELDEHHDMTVGDFGEFSCTVELTPSSQQALGGQIPPGSFIRIPIVRGMVFTSAVYKDLTPQFFSNILIRNLTLDPRPMADGWVKYRFLIENGVTWLLYAKPDRNGDAPLRLEMRGQGLAVATSGRFTGLVQIAKLPVGTEDEAERLYDQAMGVYPIEGELVIRRRYINRLVDLTPFKSLARCLPKDGIQGYF